MTGNRSAKPKDVFNNQAVVKTAKESIDAVLQKTMAKRTKACHSAVQLLACEPKKRPTRNLGLSMTGKASAATLKIDSSLNLRTLEPNRESMERGNLTTKWADKFKEYKIPTRMKSRGSNVGTIIPSMQRSRNSVFRSKSRLTS